VKVLSKEAERRANAHPDARARRRAYMRSDKGKEANRKAQENYRENYPEKVAAQQKARTHGSSGHKCARCGAPATHKHHTSYSGGGEFEWLCHPHHVKAHHPKSNITKADDAVAPEPPAAPAEPDAPEPAVKALIAPHAIGALANPPRSRRMQRAEESSMDLNSLYNQIMQADVDTVLKSFEKEPDERDDDDAADEDAEKSMTSVQTGEPTGPLGSPSANGTAGGGPGASGGQKFNGESKNGLPSVSPGATEVWSDDDRDVGSQMAPGKGALERTVPAGAGDLGQGATMEKTESDRDLARYSAAEERILRTGVADLRGVGVGIAPREANVVEKASEDARVWAQGMVLYTDASDRAIEKAQGESGFVTPEPTLGMPNAPLTSAKSCTLCKSHMPQFLSVCPCCGGEQHTAGGGFAGTVIMEKAVAAAVRPAAQHDLSLPNGLSADVLEHYFRR
jgi:hypothetical protein